ncbi:MAG: hypothetical protein ACRDB9_07650 [Cetobacterium sp.]
MKNKDRLFGILLVSFGYLILITVNDLRFFSFEFIMSVVAGTMIAVGCAQGR